MKKLITLSFTVCIFYFIQMHLLIQNIEAQENFIKSSKGNILFDYNYFKYHFRFKQFKIDTINTIAQFPITRDQYIPPPSITTSLPSQHLQQQSPSNIIAKSISQVPNSTNITRDQYIPPPSITTS